MIPRHKYEIAKLQLQTQKQKLKELVIEQKQRLTPLSSRQTYLFIEELENSIGNIGYALTELEGQERGRNTLWSRLVVWLYKWATKDRFTG